MQLVEQLPPICLERAAVVADVHAREADDDPVRDPRWNFARDDLVLPVHSVASDEIVAFLELRHEQRDVAGIVLQIAIHADDNSATGAVEARLHRLGLAVVAGEAEDHDPRVLRRERIGDPGRSVPASVIHEHQLPQWVSRERVANRIDERRDAFLLVVHRHHDRQGWHDLMGSRREKCGSSGTHE